MSKQLRQDLRWITREGSTCSAMLGAGENCFQPYVLAASQSALASGQIDTVPRFLGALLQNIAPWGVKKVGSVRTWSVAMATLQALCLLVLAVASGFFHPPVWAIFLGVSLYWAAAWSVGPAWNTWMDSLVPARLRAPFFSRRNSLCWLSQWASMMGAIALIETGRHWEALTPIFSSLFAVAGLARLASAYCMSRQSEPLPLPPNYRVLSFTQALEKVRSNPKAHSLLYILGAQLSLGLAAPFLMAYLIQVRQHSYATWLLLLSAAIFTRALVLPRLGRVAQTMGARRLFRLSGLGLALVPLLWLLPFNHLLWCLSLQSFTGGCLAAYELAVTLVNLEAIPPADRTSVLTRFSIFNTLATMLGSSLGATLLWFLPSYGLLFTLAALARVAALRLLAAPPMALPAPPSNTRKPQIRHRQPLAHLEQRLRAQHRAPRRNLTPPKRRLPRP